jgi:hypothetical protein
MKNNSFLKIILVIQTLGLLLYSFIAFRSEGANLWDIFYSNILSLNWNGQFNLDFLCYLLLSALWIMWRNKFSGKSIILGALASILGIVVFAPYLLFLISKEKGDLKQVFVGNR